MKWLAVGILLAVALIALDRAVAHSGRRSGRARRGPRPARTGRSGGSGALGELIEVFQPAHHHLVAEQERQRGEIRQKGSAAPPLGIDLDAGIATLAAPAMLPASHPVVQRSPNTRSPTMAIRSELFVADHAGALARVDAGDAQRKPEHGLASLQMPGVGALDLEVLGEIAARAVHFGSGDVELQEVDLDRESLLELPRFLREVLVELGVTEDADLPAQVAAQWATEDDLQIAPGAALSLVTSIVSLVTEAAEAEFGVYLWTKSA